MEPEDDIPTKGTPGEDGYDPAGEAPFADPEAQAEEQLDDQEGSPEGADDQPDLGDVNSIQAALEEAQQANEPPQPVGSEGGDPKPDIETPAAGDSLPTESDLSPPEADADFPEADEPEDLPVQEVHAEEAAPDLAELDETQKALSSFGDDIEQFNAAGGVGDDVYSGTPDSPDMGGGEDGMRQFAEANTQLHTAQYEFLKDHARALNDLQRRLEIERL